MIDRPHDHSSRLARGELADEAAAERLEAAAPEAYLRRRDFLTRTAALAGAAGMSTLLPAETLIAEAAKRQARRPLPSPSNLPIDTFVILMMENRSFDHYFGWHPRADSRNEGLRYRDLEGELHPTYRLTPDFQGCGHPDPDHGWDGGRWQWHRGRNDRFFTGNREGTGSDEFAIGYYLKEDLAFLPVAADEYTLYDRWFCSIMASTYPNRHYQWSAQSGGQKTNEIPAGQLGNQWETIFDRASANGLTVGYYNSDLPFAALYGLRGLAWTKPISTFYAQAWAGTLPNICIVDPPFVDGGGGDGCSADEHPHGDIRLGQAFMDDTASGSATSTSATATPPTSAAGSTSRIPTRSRPTCPTRSRSARTPAALRGPPRSGPSAPSHTTCCCSRPRATSTGLATSTARPPTASSSASPTR